MMYQYINLGFKELVILFSFSGNYHMHFPVTWGWRKSVIHNKKDEEKLFEISDFFFAVASDAIFHPQDFHILNQINVQDK